MTIGRTTVWDERRTDAASIAGRGVRRILAAGAVAALAVSAATAQEATGRIVGRVVTEAEGEPITGASVMLAGTDVGALTNRDGGFLLDGVSAGEYAVVVQVIGYAAETVSGIAVVPGGTAHLEVGLAPEAVSVEGITVRASVRRGSATALAAERRSAGIVLDAVGAEQIARAPDGDAAAVLARAPGVTIVDGRFVHVRGLGDRYGSASLNGAPLPSPEADRKAVPLDLVPSSFLESVVTAKTYSPDQPGDHAGGLVQIRTRRFPPERILKLGMGASYTPGATFETGLASHAGAMDILAGDGARALPDLPAQRVTAGHFDPARLEAFGEGFTGSWGPTPATLPLAQSLSLTLGDRTAWLDGAVPIGFLLALNQSTGQGHRTGVERVLTSAGMAEPAVDYDGTTTTRSASVGGMLNLTVEPAPSHRVTLSGMYSRSAEDEARIFEGYNLDFSANQRNTRLRFIASDLLSGQLQGEHALKGPDGATLEWRAGAARTSRFEPDTREVLYRQVPDGRYLFDTFVQSGSIFHSDLDEIALTGGVDLTVPVGARGADASVAIGGAIETHDRSAVARRFRFLPVGSVPEDVRARHPDELFTAETIDPLGFEIQEATFPGDNYDAAARVLAAYAMIDAELFPRLRLVGGARVERATQRVTPLDRFVATASPLAPAELDDLDVLPAINLTFSATDDANVRLGLSRTLARPRFRELAPFQFTDYAGGYLTMGNPALVRSRIDNYDLRWEWFPGLRSVVAVSGFLKRFHDPIETVVLSSTEAMRTWANTDDAVTWGAELELRAALGDLGLNANLTWAASEVSSGESVRVFLPFGAGLTDLSVADRTRTLQGQSPLVVNLGLTWDRDGTTVSALYNWFGRRIDTVGGSTVPDIHEEGRGTLDLVLEQALGGGFSAKLAGKRLAGSQVEFAQDGQVVRSYDLGRVISLGVAWDLGR